jgi:hypothetical protein
MGHAMSNPQLGAAVKRNSHIFERAENDWYVEAAWCAERLFEVETFPGTVWDPACGGGTIPEAARRAGYTVHASDIVDRGYRDAYRLDFLRSEARHASIVTNPPFNKAGQFVRHALGLAEKVAIIFPVARLNAANWIKGTPLRRAWFLTPRPSMPPGRVLAAGEKPGGGKTDSTRAPQSWAGCIVTKLNHATLNRSLVRLQSNSRVWRDRGALRFNGRSDDSCWRSFAI